jgi:hypothetical protein
MRRDFDLGAIQVTGSAGIDAVFEQNPSMIRPHKGRRRVASLQDLAGFTRVSADTLVHKSQQELWSLAKEGDKFFIQRLFDDNGTPVKG